jgi:hypothetical protein
MSNVFVIMQNVYDCYGMSTGPIGVCFTDEKARETVHELNTSEKENYKRLILLGKTPDPCDYYRVEVEAIE